MTFRRFALLVLLTALLPHAGYAQNLPALTQKSPDAAEIADTLTQSGSVRVIVRFDQRVPAITEAPDAAGIAAIKARVAAVRDAIVATHFGDPSNPSAGAGFPRGLNGFDITPGFAVNVNAAELDKLAADPRVGTINFDRAMPPTLYQSVPLIGMPAAYGLGATGQGYMVAVLDTGVQSNHEFLNGKVVAEACFSNSGGGAGGVSLCPNGQSSQTGAGAANPDTAQCINGSANLCEHGTHVAGIAAGFDTIANNGPPYGVAKNAKIFAVQVFTRFNSAASCGSASVPCISSFTSDQVSALDIVFQNLTVSGFKVASVNMSLGGGPDTSSTCDGDPQKPAIDNLRAAGVLTAIASGNDSSTTLIAHPGCISSATTVGSTTKQDVISSFSNMSNVVDLLAPGGFGGGSCTLGGNNPDILSSVPGTSTSATNQYACLAGTSMATPTVAGAIAAVRSACPGASASAIESALISTGLSINDTRSGGTFTKPRIRVNQAVGALGCGGSPTKVATHDYNGDGHSDVLLRDDTGAIQMWLMNGATINQNLTVANIPLSYTIVGQRDFNGDGKSDILWHQDNGNVIIWLMNGNVFTASVVVGNVPANWNVVGTGDFNGDGKGDVLWRDGGGNVAVWFMNGTTLSSVVTLGNIPNNWNVVGTADFNNDGKTDILWRDGGGNVAVWLMNGSQIASVVTLGNIPANWNVVGTGDFDANGKGDILWRDGGGNVAAWFMNGASIASVVTLGNIPTNWFVTQTGDYNFDAKSDIMWRDTGGDVAIWFMNGPQIGLVGSVGTFPPALAIQGAGAD